MSIHTTFPPDDWDIGLREQFRSYIIMVRDEVARIIHDIEHGKTDEAKDLRWLVKDLEKTRKEVLSLEKRISDEADADPTQIFDFDATRDTIGGKLDRLRQSYCPTDVSE